MRSSLETGPLRPLPAPQELRDLPVLRSARPQEGGWRPPGARRVLRCRPAADESTFPRVSRLQISATPMPTIGRSPDGRFLDGARRLPVGRLLRHDQRTDRGNLRARLPGLRGRANRHPAAGLPVSDDGHQYGDRHQDDPNMPFWAMLKGRERRFSMRRICPRRSGSAIRNTLSARLPRPQATRRVRSVQGLQDHRRRAGLGPKQTSQVS